MKFSLADGDTIEKEANLPTSNPLFWHKFLKFKSTWILQVYICFWGK